MSRKEAHTSRYDCKLQMNMVEVDSEQGALPLGAYRLQQALGSSPKGLSEICLFESPKMTNFLSEIAYLTAPRGEIFENPVRKLPI